MVIPNHIRFAVVCLGGYTNVINSGVRCTMLLYIGIKATSAKGSLLEITGYCIWVMIPYYIGLAVVCREINHFSTIQAVRGSILLYIGTMVTSSKGIPLTKTQVNVFEWWL